MPMTKSLKRRPFITSIIMASAVGYSALSWANTLPEAQLSFDKGEYSTAVIELKNLLQEEPQNASARLLLGQTYLKQMNPQAATKEFERARQLGSETSNWAIPLTRSYFLLGDADNTIAQQSLAESLPKHQQAELFALIGHAHLARNEIFDGKENFQRSLDSENNAYAKVGLARISMLEQDIDQASDLLSDALVMEPDNLEALLSQSQLLASQGQFNAALEAINHALELNPQLQNARLMRSELYIQTNQLDKAREETNQLLKINPNNGLAHFTLARLQLDAKEYHAAQVSADKALRALPEHLMTHFVLGSAHYAQQNFEQAQFYLERFVSAQPNHLVATRLLGATYLQLNDASSAVELLSNYAHSTATQDVELLNLLGRAYLQTGDYDRGTETLSLALSIDPNTENTRTQLAMGEIASGNITTAIAQLEDAIKLPDATPQTNIMLILAYLNQQQYDNATAAIEQAQRQYPDYAIFLNLKGVSLKSQQKISAAKQAYQAAIELDNTFIPALLALAKLESKEQQYAAAKNYLNKALKINSEHQQTLLSLAQLAEAQNNSEEMLKWLQQARRSNPQAYMPVNMLVSHYLQSNDLEKASNEASRYYTEQGKNSGSLSLMARVHLAAKEYDKARSYLQDLVNTNPKDVSHRLQLAQLYIRDQQFNEGLKYLDEALALDPSNGTALSARAGTLIALERFDEAQQTIDRFTENHPENYMSQRLEGDLFAAQQKTDLAINAYESAFDQTKTSYLANRLSNLYQETGEPVQARQTLETYLEAVPGDYNQRLKLASLYQQANNRTEAIKHYELIAKDVDNLVVLNNLAWLYWLENSSNALATAKKAHQMSPDTPEVTDTYGWIMLHLGNQAEAVKLIQEAATKRPANPDIRYHLAKALAETGNKAQAKKEITRLLRDYSGFEEEPAAKALAAELE